MAKNIRLASGETTVAGTLASYTVEAGDSQLRIKCAKDSAVALRWQVKDGVVITDDITASTGNVLAAGEGWVLEPDVGELQVIGESGTATYEVTISRG